MIKCSECGTGIMKSHKIADDKVTPWGHGFFTKKRHSGSFIEINGSNVYFGNLSHLDDEVIVVCSNFPDCNNHYVMKKRNLKCDVSKKTGAVKIKGYGEHHFTRHHYRW